VSGKWEVVSGGWREVDKSVARMLLRSVPPTEPRAKRKATPVTASRHSLAALAARVFGDQPELMRTALKALASFLPRPLRTTHYSLLAANCSLLTTSYFLPTAHCSLLTTHYSLLTTHHSPLTTHYSLLTTCYLL